MRNERAFVSETTPVGTGRRPDGGRRGRLGGFALVEFLMGETRLLDRRRSELNERLTKARCWKDEATQARSEHRLRPRMVQSRKSSEGFVAARTRLPRLHCIHSTWSDC
jgi:hypothetical protein